MIYTTVSLVKQNSIGYCGPGMERGIALMKELGAGPATPIQMLTILDRLGVSDMVFCMCAMRGNGHAQRAKIMAAYMCHLFDALCSYLVDEQAQYAVEFKAVRKRCEGHNRPALLHKAVKVIKQIRDTEPDRSKRHALFGLMCLASPYPDYLAATHAGIPLMDAGYDKQLLKDKLQELLGGTK